MAVKETGFPDRTFFEIFDGECNGKSAGKIYSIQVKDWKNYFVDREGNYVQTAAVVDADITDQTLYYRADHLRVVPTKGLQAFLAKRGITLSGVVWVTPYAFSWLREGEFDPTEDDDPIVIPEFEEPELVDNSKKIWLLAALAALALLSDE